MPNLKDLVGTVFTGRVRDLSSEGAGVVPHPEGPIFFVENTWPGDLAEVCVESCKGRYGYARLLRLVERSAERVENVPCAHQGSEAGQCGGCPWMIATPEAQLARKQARVQYALARAKIDLPADGLLPIQGSNSWGYRNRAQFKTEGERLGFVSRGQHEIADVKDCLVLNDRMRARLGALRAQLPNAAWKPSGRYSWNFIDCDDDQVSSEAVQLNKRRPFRQGNTRQNEFMRAWLRTALAKRSVKGEALELFCGSGNFTEILQQQGLTPLTALEVSREALGELEAKRLPGVRCIAMDLQHRWQWERLAKDFPAAALLFLDPPREGAEGVAQLAERLPLLEYVFYVSCDLGTWVRDAGALQRAGYMLEELKPLDMFPHTPHVELISIFKINKLKS